MFGPISLTRQWPCLIVVAWLVQAACGESQPPPSATLAPPATVPAERLEKGNPQDPLPEESPTTEHRRTAEVEGRRPPEATPQSRGAFDEAMSRGAAELYSGRFDAARKHFFGAMDLRPDATAAALGALRSMTPRGHGEERSNVERILQRQIDALLSEPKTRGAGRLLAARVAIALGRPGQAMSHAHLAAALLPELGEVWRVVGDAAAQGELWSKAAEAYRKALDLDSAGRVETLERLADSLDELGDYAGAESAARESLEGTGVTDQARRRRLNLLGAILKHRGAHDEARSITSTALELGPDDPAILHNLGSIEEARGRLDSAERLYRKALTQSPVPMTSWRLGHLLLKQDRRKEAVRALTDAAARLDQWTWPKSTRWWPAYDVGRVYALAGHEREAIGWFEDAMRLARGGRSVREVRTWLTWARVQAGLEKEPAKSEPSR